MKVMGFENRHMLIALGGLLIFGAALLTPAQAQRQMPTPKERANTLKGQLSLSDKQTAGVEKILDSSQVKMRSLGGKYQDDRQARREAMQSVMKETDEKIEALLTTEQKTKYEDLVKQRRSRFSGRGS